MYLHFFPPEFIALQLELKNHPEILEKIADCADNAEAYGVIAAELGILLDGWYEPCDLAHMLVMKLKDKNAIILTPEAVTRQSNPRLIQVRVTETKDSIKVDLAPEEKDQRG